MPNLVESFIDKVKTPDKLELSPADRQLLKKLIDSIETLKEKKKFSDTQLKETEEHLSTQLKDSEHHLDAQIKELDTLLNSQICISQDNLYIKIREVLEEIKNLPEPPDVNSKFDELKHFISEQTEQEKYQFKTQLEDKHNAVSSQLQGLKSAIKDTTILDKISSLSNQLSEMEVQQNRQMRTIKIILGFTIWLSLLTLAVIAASVLGYI